MTLNIFVEEVKFMTKIPFFKLSNQKGREVYIGLLHIVAIKVSGDRGGEQAEIKTVDGEVHRLDTPTWADFRRQNVDYLSGLPREL
jgi:hypothetical protein